MLEMRSRLVIASSEEMRLPLTSDMIYPYVRSVRVEESRFEVISNLTAVIPPYPSDRINRIKTGMILRWEAGYFEDDKAVYTGKQGSDGYHTEFEGIIVEVSRRNYYDGFDPDGLLKSDGRRDSLGIGIKAKDYMYALAQSAYPPAMIKGKLESIVPDLLATNNIRSRYNLTFALRYNKNLVNPSGIKELTGLTTPAMAFQRIRETKGPVDMVVGLDIYFRLSELRLSDPNDPEYADKDEMSAFVYSHNVIEEDVTPRAKKFIQVLARWYDPNKGEYRQAKYPNEGQRDYIAGKQMFASADQTTPHLICFDIEGDGGTPDVQKEAEDIYVRINGDGLVGSILAFGYPAVHRGDIILYIGSDSILNKAVLVDKVVKVYDAETAKFRQEITPGFTPTPIENPIVGDTSPATFEKIKKSQKERAEEIQNKVKLLTSKVQEAKR